MPTRNVNLTAELDRFVSTSVATGRYENASEVVRAAVRALDREEAAMNEWLKQRIQESLSDPAPDRPAAAVFRRLRARAKSKAAR